MNIKKISIGLLFLLALVVVPGTLALPEYKPGSNGLHVSTASPGCETNCHPTPMPVFCARCHAYPYATPVATPTPAATPAVTTTTPQLTPSITKEIPDEKETQEETEPQEETETPVTAAGTPTTPGFGIVAAIVGLFAWAFLARREK